MHVAERFDLPDGYVARPYLGRPDHPAMAAILTAFRLDQGVPELVTAAHLDASYDNLIDCDLATDAFVLERHGDPVGYGRTPVTEVRDATEGFVFTPVLPNHLTATLFHALTDGVEAHLVDRLTPHRHLGEHVRLRSEARLPGPGQDATGVAAWLEARGYEARHWGAALVRRHLDDIPDRSLPDGVELRPATENQLRTIVESYFECFRGEWDFSEPTEADYRWLLDDPDRDHTLWQVAWAGDQVVGQVKPFINHEENDARGYLRGYTEFISTHEDWRNQGIAGTLLAWSLLELKNRGMTEAALSVDTNNPGGAFQLYQALGFELDAYGATYFRDLLPAAPTATSETDDASTTTASTAG